MACHEVMNEEAMKELLSLAKTVASLTRPRREHHPGIGAGMLLTLIEQAERAIAKVESKELRQ